MGDIKIISLKIGSFDSSCGKPSPILKISVVLDPRRIENQTPDNCKGEKGKKISTDWSMFGHGANNPEAIFLCVSVNTIVVESCVGKSGSGTRR